MTGREHNYMAQVYKQNDTLELAKYLSAEYFIFKMFSSARTN